MHFEFFEEKYYNKSEGPTIQSVINMYILQITKVIKSVNASQILDVETKDSSMFVYILGQLIQTFYSIFLHFKFCRKFQNIFKQPE